ncbi:hypothetical protein ORD22_14865 [Sporosarcina sp. GW1-11]|uniref:hypothetical protein n=1 Tax=Sporosarcina sp. GW1-11 TaxID=2899126 RepID=UPI00294DDE14|nr:hypothetical protein [Sporosarcina sp. GW1-11]MDV6379495.1 hypothetical protein [Sporosarcina sp. GW1-11]
MRQKGDLPFWLIAGAIRQRRSGFSDELHFYIQKHKKVSRSCLNLLLTSRCSLSTLMVNYECLL